ncbi:hypothetical protein B0F90DRAFT_1791230, partial [Multifurca ochricompacta]
MEGNNNRKQLYSRHTTSAALRWALVHAFVSDYTQRFRPDIPRDLSSLILSSTLPFAAQLLNIVSKFAVREPCMSHTALWFSRQLLTRVVQSRLTDMRQLTQASRQSPFFLLIDYHGNG